MVFVEKTSGSLKIPEEELEESLRAIYSDPDRDIQVGSMDGLSGPQELEVPFDLCRIRLAEVQAIVRKARAKAVRGPSRITYAVYKNCPELTKYLWNLMAGVWESGDILDSWCIAGGIYISKGKDSVSLKQFRWLSLLNVEGKIFFVQCLPKD